MSQLFTILLLIALTVGWIVPISEYISQQSICKFFRIDFVFLFFLFLLNYHLLIKNFFHSLVSLTLYLIFLLCFPNLLGLLLSVLKINLVVVKHSLLLMLFFKQFLIMLVHNRILTVMMLILAFSMVNALVLITQISQILMMLNLF